MEDNKVEDVNKETVFDGGFFSLPSCVQREKVKQYLKSPVKDINDRWYNMNYKRRGMAVIFNHQTFEDPNLANREGTDEDCKMLYSCLNKLEFNVEKHDNLTIGALKDEIGKIAKMDHSDSDCLMIFILSHGQDNGYILAKDGAYAIGQITRLLTSNMCPTLAGKPKIIFVEACHGKKSDPGVYLKCTTDGSTHCNVYKVPINADFLIVNSSVPGYYSARNTKDGTWFIQALTAELEQDYDKLEKLDLVTLLTFANNRLALLPSVPSELDHKQIFCITSMLTRLIKFEPKMQKAT